MKYLPFFLLKSAANKKYSTQRCSTFEERERERERQTDRQTEGDRVRERERDQMHSSYNLLTEKYGLRKEC